MVDRRMWGIGLVLLIGAPACADGPGVSAETSGVVVRDSAGTEIVLNTGEGPPPERAWRIDSTPILTLGAVTGEDAVQFSQIPAATRLSDGRIVVVEGQNAEIRYFSPAGEHLLTVGGQGEGPGEFNFVGTLLRLPGDSLLAEDQPRRRQVVYAPDGSLVSETVVDMQAWSDLGVAGECQGALFPDRSRIRCRPEPGLGTERQTAASGFTHLGTGLVRSIERFVWVDAAATTATPIGLHGGLEQFGMERSDGGFAYALHPFYSRTRQGVSFDPPRHVVALNPLYSIEFWTPEGELERVVRRQPGRRPADPELSERGLEQASRYVSDEQTWNRMKGEMLIPDSIPAAQALAVGRDGSILVGRTSSLEVGAPTVYDSFDASGRFMGEIALPPRSYVLELGEDYVLGVRYDDFDVPFVELWHLDRGGA